MRVALATALFAAPDLLLLDEPTNHLDLEATLWLETWLAKFPGAAIIVSHDRGLLDRCVHAIAHLDRGKINVTPGGYDEFVRIRTERAMQQTAMAAKVAAQRAHMQAYVDRFRFKASKARQAQARLKAIAKLPAIEAVVEDSPTHFDFPQPVQIAPPILALDGVTAGYDGRPVLRGLSLRVDMDDRIALLGANGNGKSTLAKLVAGRLAPMSGEVRRGPKLKVGYFAQHQADELVPDETPVQHMARALPRAAIVQVRAQLARFGLDADRAGTAVSSLSGGEKARLLLALATRDAPQLLILDEPTNHLDIDAREALVRALADFEGAVLLITHDPHLVELVADRLWLVGRRHRAALRGRPRRVSRPAGRACPTGSEGRRRPDQTRGPPRARRGPRRHRPLAPPRPRRRSAHRQACRRNAPKSRRSLPTRGSTSPAAPARSPRRRPASPPSPARPKRRKPSGWRRPRRWRRRRRSSGYAYLNSAMKPKSMCNCW